VKSLFLIKFQVVDSDIPSLAAATGGRGCGEVQALLGSGDGGGVVGGASAVATVCESVKDDKTSVTIANLERKLEAVAKLNSVCMIHKVLSVHGSQESCLDSTCVCVSDAPATSWCRTNNVPCADLWSCRS